MAKGFSEKEKELIRRKLLDAGKEYFEWFGVRKTNVADLARKAGIAKGSFYLFFESKEDLFLTINEEFDRQLQKEAALRLKQSRNPRDTFKEFLLYVMDLFDSDPMLKLAANKEEFESLSRKIPADKFRQHQENTTEFLAGLIERWQKEGMIRHHDPKVIVGTVKSLYYVVLHKEFIGEDIFPHVVDLLLDSIINNLTIDVN
jgi:AcrR family transcriptional regulator